MNILRRLPLPRLLLVCGLVIAIGVSATALAFALGSGPTPPAKPLAEAIHDALGGPRGKPIEGLSASIVLTDHLLEGASLAGGGQAGELTSSPLVTGASGRLWIAKGGRLRLELQSESGDTQILYDGHTLTLYDAATNTLYRYTPPAATQPAAPAHPHEVPSVASIEQAIAHLSQHADVSGAIPTDVAGQPAYTVRVSPKEGGSLLGGAELSWDADNGVPLRAAIYSSASSAPVIELAATEISFGPVTSSVFEVNPPANAKIEEIKTPTSSDLRATHRSARGASRPKLSTHGHGPSTIVVLTSSRYGEGKTGAGAGNNAGGSLEDLPKVAIDGVSASELRTELGTLLTFERSGVRYLIAGAVGPAAVEEAARGL
jgi:outer membrane lipoprotein-sorting protein